MDERNQHQENTKQPPASKRGGKTRRTTIIVGVVGAVILAAGIGFFIWHEQPSFCNAICHQPMDKYVESYYDEDGVNLAATHAKAEKNCLDCHEPTLSEQIAEGMAWATGDFYMTEDGYVYDEELNIGTKEFCFRCHNDDDASTGKDWPEIVASTEDYRGNEGYNVHENHLSGSFQCGDCHSAHKTSFMSCNDGCHDLELPEGWDGGGIM